MIEYTDVVTLNCAGMPRSGPSIQVTVLALSL
jgi:hypothetical protein